MRLPATKHDQDVELVTSVVVADSFVKLIALKLWTTSWMCIETDLPFVKGIVTGIWLIAVEDDLRFDFLLATPIHVGVCVDFTFPFGVQEFVGFQLQLEGNWFKMNNKKKTQ